MRSARRGRSRAAGRLLAEYPFWTLCALLLACFLFGGSGRSDPVSLLLLRPLSAAALAIALIGLTRDQLRQSWPAVAFIGAVVGLAVIHLIPLPPAVWTALPGRELAAAASPTAGMAQPWRPITLVPWRGLNGLFSLIVPAAALLLALQCPLEQRRRLVGVVLALTGFSVALALLQAIGGFQPGLYPYAITNFGAPVGLFANRNHQAALLCCAFPLLAYYASGVGRTGRPQSWRQWASAAGGLMVLLMLLATGSRAGLAIGIVALAVVPVLFRPAVAPSDTRVRRGLLIVLGVLAIGLVVVLALMIARASAFDRLLNIDEGDERFQAWGPIARLVWDYFPVGSGIGSFVEVYKVVETNAALRATYLNHAHSDWLEWALEGGLPAVMLGVVAVAGWARATRQRWRDVSLRGSGAHLGLTAAVVMFLLGLASIVDYPLRTPALACLMAIAGVLAFSRAEGRNSA